MTRSTHYYFSDGGTVRGPVPVEEVARRARLEGLAAGEIKVMEVDGTVWRAFAEVEPEAALLLASPAAGAASAEAKKLRRHLVRVGGRRWGPLNDEELEEQAAKGLPGGAEARQAGMVGWLPLEEYLETNTRPAPEAAGQGTAPRLVPQAVEPSGQGRLADLAANPFVARARDTASASAGLAKLFVSRIVKSDFTLVRARDSERRLLESGRYGIRSALAQDYAAWRRALLVISLVLFGLIIVHDVPVVWRLEFNAAPLPVKIWRLALHASHWAAAVLIGLALANWTGLALSRRLAWIAWCAQFFGPMTLLMIPLGSLGVPEDAAVLLGVSFTLLLGAKIVGLFYGLLRSALTVKTLLPQGGFTAWVVGAVAPFSALFLLLSAAAAVQMSQSALALALVAFTVCAAAPLLQLRDLAAACDEEAASRMVRAARRAQGRALLVGLIFLGFYLVRLMNVEEFKLMDLTRLVVAYLANLLLVTLAAADLIIVLTKRAVEQRREAEGSPGSLELEQRLEALL
jgi:hypothetical protein